MKRSSFILIAAIIPMLFSLVMMFVPDQMLSNSLRVEVDLSTRVVTQWVGFGVFSVGLVNLLARNDPGSIGLKAIMVGNIAFHSLGIGFDTYDYSIGIMKLEGLITGLIPHSLLTVGFIYYLLKLTNK